MTTLIWMPMIVTTMTSGIETPGIPSYTPSVILLVHGVVILSIYFTLKRKYKIEKIKFYSLYNSCLSIGAADTSAPRHHKTDANPRHHKTDATSHIHFRQHSIHNKYVQACYILVSRCFSHHGRGT